MVIKRAVATAALLFSLFTSAFSADCVMGRYEPSQTSHTSEKLQLPAVLNWEYVGNKFENNPASPVVSGNTVVFACGDRVYAVDLTTGAAKWRYPSDQGLSGSVKSTPAIYGGNVYFGAGENLYCIALDTGTFKWAYQTRGSIRCPPVISEGVVFFGSDDNNLYAIHADTGDPAWKPFAARDDIAVGIAIGSGMIVMSCMDGNTYGVLASSGKLRWPPFRLPAAPTDTSPVISEGIAVMAVGNVMYGLTARSGQLRWMVSLPAEVAATPAVLGYDVYVPCRDKKIYAYSTTGRQPAYKWAAPADLGAVPMSSPVIAGDTLWVTGSRGVVAAFSIADGSLKWRYVVAPSPVTTPTLSYCDAASSPTIANGNLLVLTDDGVLHCFNPDAADNIPPGIFTMQPASGTRMSGAPPIKLSAVLYDIGCGVDKDSVAMLLDGNPVEAPPDKPLFDVTTGTVTYVTPIGGDGKQALTLKDGIHTITVSAKDYLGNLLQKDWYIVTDSSLPPPRRAAPPPDPGKKTKEPPTKQPPTPPTPPAMPTPPTPPGMEMPPPPPPPPAPGPGGPEGF